MSTENLNHNAVLAYLCILWNILFIFLVFLETFAPFKKKYLCVNIVKFSQGES